MPMIGRCGKAPCDDYATGISRVKAGKADDFLYVEA